MVEKTEGATQTCKCGTQLTCVKIISEWQGKKEEKLQWQNSSDGKSHYKFAGPGKFDCVIPNDSNSINSTVSNDITTTTQISTTTSFKRQHVTDEEEIVWNSILDKLIEYDILAEKRLSENIHYDSSNPAHNGQLKNWAFAVNQEYKKHKFVESQMKSVDEGESTS